MTGKKHILFISSWYPTELDPTLGIFNVYFARAVALYNNVTVLRIVPASEPMTALKTEKANTHGLQTVTVTYPAPRFRIPILSQVVKKMRVSAAAIAGFDFISKEFGKPDLIHLNVAMPMGVPVLELSREYQIPYVVNENWSGYTREDNSYRGFIQKHFTKKIIHSASAILPTSDYLREAMQSHQLKGDYYVIPNVVNVELFRPLPDVKKNGEITFIHVSSLNDREKNVSGLIRGFAMACKERKDLRLVIVGEGVDKDKYLTLVKESGLQRHVEFKGRLFSDDLIRSINQADAMVMFSHFETFCLVNIEAFACGKPVISSRVGAIPSYVNKERGLLVESGNEKQLADALLDFAKNKGSYNSQQIREYAVNNYSYEVIGRKLDNIYTVAISKGRHV